MMMATPLLLPHQAQKKVLTKDKPTKATEDKIVGQWRFTVVSSPNVMAIQAERNRKAKQCKIQAKIDETARALALTTSKETLDTAVAQASCSSVITNNIETVEGLNVPKKRSGKFKCVGGFCQAESCKTKAIGWVLCKKMRFKSVS
jgi:hypothetical protein